MSDGPDKSRLDALEQRLEEMRQAGEPQPVEESHYQAASAAWRMVIELVVGLLLGLGIGYGLDRIFGTEPWLMILFILFGFAAGVRTMMRTAQEIQAKNIAAGGSTAPAQDDKMYDDD